MTQDECIAEMKKHFGRKATAWEGRCSSNAGPFAGPCQTPELHGKDCPGEMPVYSVAEMSEVTIDKAYSYGIGALARGATWEDVLEAALHNPLRPPFVIPPTCMEHYRAFITAPTDDELEAMKYMERKCFPGQVT
jgi:hypothetical protein